jgi:hypothetical protein
VGAVVDHLGAPAAERGDVGGVPHGRDRHEELVGPVRSNETAIMTSRSPDAVPVGFAIVSDDCIDPDEVVAVADATTGAVIGYGVTTTSSTCHVFEMNGRSGMSFSGW